MIATDVCKTFRATKGFKAEEEVKGDRRLSVNMLEHSLHWMLPDLGLPGNEYARVVRVQKLNSPVWRKPALFELQVDNGTYTQFTVTIAVCGCPQGHVLRSSFREAEEWIIDPHEVGAD